jgi:hypothetical protein
MVNPSDCLWGKEFFDTYFKHARKRSYNNDVLHKAAALSLIGQSVRNVRLRSDQNFIDCRIHPFIIQSSGTGKNSAFNFMSTVAEAAGMTFDEHGKDSTAGIMGTVKRNGESEKGDLAGSGFVAWKEAQQLVKATQADHSSDLLEVINQALDPSGKVSRALSGGKLEYNSRTSLFATTYPPDPEDQVDLIHQGFLPRTLFVYRRWNDDQYDAINELRDDKLPRPDESNKSYRNQHDDDVEKLANTLKYIEDTVWQYGEVLRGDESHYAQGHEHIEYFEGVEDGVTLNPTPILRDVLEEYPYKVRKIARPFITRLYDTVYKISACLAAVDVERAEDNPRLDQDIYVSRRIKEHHVKHAKQMVKESWVHILEFIQDYMVNVADSPVLQTEETIKEICMNDSGLATVREVMVETGQTKQQVQQDVATLQEMGKIEPVQNTPHALEPDDFVAVDEDTQIWRDSGDEKND